MKSRVFWSPKGGTGKTTQLIQQFNQLDNVVAFDCDPQADLTFKIGKNPLIQDIVQSTRAVFHSSPYQITYIPLEEIEPTKYLARGNLKLSVCEQTITATYLLNLLSNSPQTIFPCIINSINDMGITNNQIYSETPNRIKPVDIALIDTNPNITYLNCHLVMTSDEWFIPLEENTAINTLNLIELILAKYWLSAHKKLCSKNNLYYPYKTTMPTIVGGSLLSKNLKPESRIEILERWDQFLKSLNIMGIKNNSHSLSFLEY